MGKMMGTLFCTVGKMLDACECEKQELVPQLTFSGEMDIYELSSILIDKFPDTPIYLPDSLYKLCSIQDVKRFLEWDNTDKQKYLAEMHDCDDFAYRLKGQISIYPWSAIPFGIVWTNIHALNIVVLSDKEIYFVEPQSDKILETLEPWQGTEIRFIAL